jgi:hypothetical protein
MIEMWPQYTCNGCGETDTLGCEQSRKEIREWLATFGWKHYGRFDYCKECVANGKAKARDRSFGLDPA